MKYAIGWGLFIVILAILLLSVRTSRTGHVEIPLSAFERELSADNVKWVEIERDSLVGVFTGTRPIGGTSVTAFRTRLPEGTTQNWAFTQWLLENRRNATVDVGHQSNLLLNVLVPLIPWLLIFLFIWFFVFRQLRRTQKNAEPLRVVVVNPSGATPPAAPAPGTSMPPPPLPDA